MSSLIHPEFMNWRNYDTPLFQVGNTVNGFALLSFRFFAKAVKQFLERRSFFQQKGFRWVELNDPSMIHERDFIEVENSIKLVGDCDDCLVFEVATNDLLHELVCLGIHTSAC